MRRPLRIIGLAVALTAAAAPAAAAPVRPHLVPLLPTAPSAEQHAPVFVDALEQPGHLLYRFDAVIENTGHGALDVFGLSPVTGAPSNDVRQALWDGGLPGAAPQDPGADPTGLPGVSVSDRTAASPAATWRFATGSGLADWRVPQTAEYALQVPGGPDRGSAARDLGACLADSYGPTVPAVTRYFPEGATGGSVDPHRTWCRPFASPLAGGADPPLVRGGISPGWGDLDAAQDGGQWIDVTGLAPGTYALRARVNPDGHLLVDPPAAGDDVLIQERVVPGVVASDVAASPVAGREERLALGGTVTGPEIPARASASGACADGTLSPATPLADCYRTADGSLAFALASPPAHGTVTIGASSGPAATASYTPAAGYAGPDSFTYVATDSRGLPSAPATVTLDVRPAPTTVVAALFPRTSMPHRLSQVKRLAVTVHLGRVACGVRVLLYGSRLTRHPAPYHPIAVRRVGCASKVRLTARRPRPGVWRIRAVVLVGGRSFVSPVRRVIVSPPDPAGPAKTG